MNAAARAPHPLIFAALGTLVFLNVYAPQSLLPLLAREFRAGPAGVSGVVGATLLAMSLASPLAGLLADLAGRWRTVLAAFAGLILPAARFAQGLLIPGVMVALTAYIAEERPPAAPGPSPPT